MLKRFQDKVAIVTGGARGIGAAICEKLAQEGARIVVNYVENAEAAKSVVKRIKEKGEDAFSFCCDVSEFSQADDMMEETFERFGRIDILVNNAGIFSQALVEEVTPEEWQKDIEVNLIGTFNCSKAVIPYLKKREKGRIINCSSISAKLPDIGLSGYAASKAAINNFTMVLAAELAPYNITVNAYGPGIIETDMTRDMILNRGDGQLKQIALRRFGKPEEVANPVTFLASDEADYITGVIISIDGGMLIVQNPWRARRL
ncbi:SDR family oxidoreductase [Candidatus Aerophobetes bacterium]|uniref:SDR family oxidoreductase n=1 Tax=Aerophobetes bacterium TaxID=2030807 RepID=A0A523Y4U9_UNCAE|nr:MAG: SDR family oxidoreductase [Candidatus Aerophobetes bacterium]